MVESPFLLGSAADPKCTAREGLSDFLTQPSVVVTLWKLEDFPFWTMSRKNLMGILSHQYCREI